MTAVELSAAIQAMFIYLIMVIIMDQNLDRSETGFSLMGTFWVRPLLIDIMLMVQIGG